MDKNENGYPEVRRGSNGGGCPRSEVRESTQKLNENVTTVGNGGCGGSGCVDALSLAYVYAPNQNFRMLYSAEAALKHGTLFEELYKPMEVYGRE